MRITIVQYACANTTSLYHYMYSSLEKFQHKNMFVGGVT